MADVLVIAATLMAWWSLIPQIRRLIKTRDPSGVSSSWPGIGLVTNAGWTGYLIDQELWAAVPSVVVMTVAYSLVLWALFVTGARPWRGIIAGVVWTITLVVAGLAAGWSGVGTTLAWSYLIQLAPAVTAAYTTRRPSGISPVTWVSIVIEAALWGGYGYLNGDGPVVTYSVIGVAAGSAILFRYRYAVRAASTGAAGRSTTKQV